MFSMDDYRLFCRDPENKSISELKQAAIDDLRDMEEAPGKGVPTDQSFYQRMSWLRLVITELTKQEQAENEQNG